MPFAENGSLESVLKNVRSSKVPTNYTNTTRQIILTGVKYLYNRNIIHRDLKPGNILLDKEFHPLISDFGLSKIFESNHSKSQTQFGGTLFYLAPEVIQGDNYNRKADVYAFGIQMYEIVMNLPPYPGFDDGEMNFFKFFNMVVSENLRFQ